MSAEPFTRTEDVKQRDVGLARLAERVMEAGLLGYLVLLPVTQLEPFPVVSRVLLVGSALAGFLVALLRRLRPPRSAIVGVFAVYVALSAVSALTAVDPFESSRQVSKMLLRQTAVFLLVAGLFGDPARRRRLAGALSISGLALMNVCLLLLLFGVSSPFGGLTGPAMDYNSLCMFLVPTSAFLLAFLANASSRLEVGVWGALAVVLGASMLATFSRIGWAASLLLLLIWAAADARGRGRVLVAAAGGALLFVLWLPDASALVTVTDNDRFLLEKDAPLNEEYLKPMTWRDVATMNARLEYAWKPALALIGARPLLGSGYGAETFSHVVPRAGPVLFHEHNALLAVGVQSGLGAMAAYAALLVLVVLRLARRLRGRDAEPFDRLLRVALLAAMVAEYLFQGLGEPTNNGRMGILFAALAGLTVVLPPPEEA